MRHGRQRGPRDKSTLLKVSLFFFLACYKVRTAGEDTSKTNLLLIMRSLVFASVSLKIKGWHRVMRRRHLPL